MNIDNCAGGVVLAFPRELNPARRRFDNPGPPIRRQIERADARAYAASDAPLPLPSLCGVAGAVQEVRVVAVAEAPAPAIDMTRPALVADFFRDRVARCSWFDAEKECMIVLLLDRKYRLKAFSLVSLGTVSGTLAHPREIFRPAIVASASAVVIVHNHPSGDPSPSPEDFEVTRAAEGAGNIIGITCTDHVIVGDVHRDPRRLGYFSFWQSGSWPDSKAK